jgi:hypothetical protein
MSVSTQEPTMSDATFVYEHCDIPEGTTLREHRAATRPVRRDHGLRRLIALLLPGRRAPRRVRTA